MRRETKTVWRDKGGSEIMTSTGKPDEFYIPLSTVTRETLQELGLAIQDALDEPLVAEVKRANRSE
jgi:hypothetical protein